MKKYIEATEICETCGDCIHADVCESNPLLTEFSRKNPAYCKRFRNAADVVEHKRGEWVLGHVEPGYLTPGGNKPWVCSECGWVMSWRLDKPKAKFCADCGADMREVDHA